VIHPVNEVMVLSVFGRMAGSRLANGDYSSKPELEGSIQHRNTVINE
jgi:hypothetical protein